MPLSVSPAHPKTLTAVRVRVSPSVKRGKGQPAFRTPPTANAATGRGPATDVPTHVCLNQATAFTAPPESRRGIAIAAFSWSRATVYQVEEGVVAKPHQRFSATGNQTDLRSLPWRVGEGREPPGELMKRPEPTFGHSPNTPRMPLMSAPGRCSIKWAVTSQPPIHEPFCDR